MLILSSALAAAPPRALTGEQSVAVLDRLGEIVERHHALATLHNVDAAQLMDEAKHHLRDGMSLNELLLLIQRSIAPIGDGHARIVLDRDAVNAKRGADDGRIEHLPFLAKMIGERRGDPIVAIHPNRERFVDDGHPLLESIDGVPIERWIEVISEFVPRGSPQFVRSRSLRELRSLWRWRPLLGIGAGREVDVTLTNLDRTSRVTRRLRTRTGSPSRGDWPRTESRILEENIGYLRLPTMNIDDAELDAVRAQLDTFRETRGLIVDVRGNGGGQRHLLHLLGEYLLAPESTPVVYTAVRPRLVDGGDILSPRMRRRMADRHLHPADSERWSTAERNAIDAFQQTFRPHRQVPDERFGPWHYAVLTPGSDGRSYHYRAPVVVLMNADCFSATDIFLHAMGLLENVTLMGEPSAGSSGAPLSWETGIPGVRIAVSSIVSYRTDGTIFDDGRGEEPDVRVDPVASFFIGGPDRALDAAIERLR